MLDVRAVEIEVWANRHEARDLLAVLLRRLIRASGRGVSVLDFSGHENSQRPGWDGWLESSEASPWIPEGKSGWEFSCEGDPRRKAQGDYEKRSRSPSADERKEIVFVFVTARDWPGKEKWAEKKRQEGKWRDVKAYDASDLEAWLETAPAARAWFAEQIGKGGGGAIRSVEKGWDDWSGVTTPTLPPSLFRPAFMEFGRKLKEWLDHSPPNGTMTVSADSKEEALAFVCAFLLGKISDGQDVNGLRSCTYADKAMLVLGRQGLDLLEREGAGVSATPLVAIVDDPELARGMGSFFQRIHTIVVSPNNPSGEKAKVVLGQLWYHDFRKALEETSYEGMDIDLLARQSGRSPTVLRRLLSDNDVIKRPVWARDVDIARKLVPYALVGVWNMESEADLRVIERICQVSKDQLEADLPKLLALDDAPVWRVESCRGAVSQFDLIFAIKEHIMERDIGNFLVEAKKILAERDPALDLHADNRRFAYVHDKTRECSDMFRGALAETIALLSIHGDNLFEGRGIKCSHRIKQLVRELMEPFSFEKLYSLRHDVVHYAEAAPDAFLSVLETADEEVLKHIITDPFSHISGGGARIPLLGALENIAWDPDYLARVCLMLAKFSEYRIQDNCGNTPENSFNSILKPWHPQTMAFIRERKEVLKLVFDRHPKLAWKLAAPFFGYTSDAAFSTHTPHWRRMGGIGFQRVTWKEIHEFEKFALDLYLGSEELDAEAFHILVGKVRFLPMDWVKQIWERIEFWLKSNHVTEQEKAELHEAIRLNALTGWAKKKRGDSEVFYESAQKVYDLLVPESVVWKHYGLFKNSYYWSSYDDNVEESREQREKRIWSEREKAVSEIHAKRGVDGILELAEYSEVSSVIGNISGRVIETQEEKVSLFVEACIRGEKQESDRLHSLGSGLLLGMSDSDRSSFLEAVRDKFTGEKYAPVLTLFPINKGLLQTVSALKKSQQAAYWNQVEPGMYGFYSEEVNQVVEGLLSVNRPKAASGIFIFGDIAKDVSTENIVQILKRMPFSHEENLRLDFSTVVFCFEELNRRGYSEEGFAHLEFLYFDVLRDMNRGIPNLEKQILSNPELFVQALAAVYRRSDNLEDPEAWVIKDDERRVQYANHMYSLLDSLKRIPGSDQNGDIDKEKLIEWIRLARDLCEQYGRIEMGDFEIGRLLSKCPVVQDGIWPCEEVCEAMEIIDTKACSEGFCIGVSNERGTVIRGEGGQQERSLVEQYRRWARARRNSYPFVGGILREIAESYENEAQFWDKRSALEKRGHYE